MRRRAGMHAIHLLIERAKSHRLAEMLNRAFGVAVPDPNESAQDSCRSHVGIEHLHPVE